jgi:hypothetical protein
MKLQLYLPCQAAFFSFYKKNKTTLSLSFYAIFWRFSFIASGLSGGFPVESAQFCDNVILFEESITESCEIYQNSQNTVEFCLTMVYNRMQSENREGGLRHGSHYLKRIVLKSTIA